MVELEFGKVLVFVYELVILCVYNEIIKEIMDKLKELSGLSNLN